MLKYERGLNGHFDAFEGYSRKGDNMTDWYHTSEEELYTMTVNDAIELISEDVKIGKRGGDWAPRKYMTKVYEACLKLLQKEDKNRKLDDIIGENNND